MTLSAREGALRGLLAALATIPGANIAREQALPGRVPAGGVVIQRDGEPGSPDVALSPPSYAYTHQAEVEVLASPETWDPWGDLDALLRALGTALAADRTLDGAVEGLTWDAPQTGQLTAETTVAIPAARVPVTLYYTTSDPLT